MKIQRKHNLRILFLRILLGIFLSGTLAVAYFNPYIPPPPPPGVIKTPLERLTYPPPYPPPGGYSSQIPQGPPIPPLDPKLKNFPIDLDLLDFAKRNPYPTQHCFFPVKGRKDIVEFIPNQQEGMFIFPTGACQIDDLTCTIGKRKGHLPKSKKTDPPLYASTGESRYLNFAVIPYKYVDNIDFSTCMPTWKGYIGDDELYYQPYERPKRDYSKQSCYHPISKRYAIDKERRFFCDSEKCQFDESLYCEHKTGTCYKNGYPLKTKKGESVFDTEPFGFFNWDFCTDENGSLIPEDGGPPYEDRFAPGCSYRITADNYYEKQYAGNINFLIHCDENRCHHDQLNFYMKQKEYLVGNDWSNQTYTKTPTLGEFLTIDWQCLDATKVRDYNKRLLCSLISSDKQNPDCRLCYENKKFVIKGCRYPYDELGRRADIPEKLRYLNFTEEMGTMAATVRTLNSNYDIDFELGMWFPTFHEVMNRLATTFDELERQRIAGIAAEFNKIENPGEKDVKKLKLKFAPYVTEYIETEIKHARERDREFMCRVCKSTDEESIKREIIYREACFICNSK